MRGHKVSRCPKKTRIYLDIRINGGEVKATYILEATKLETVSDNLGPYVFACGHDAHFTIDIPVTVS